MNKSNRVEISKLNAKELISFLKTNPEDDGFNILITIGQTKADWLNQTDLEYLISKINSKEKSKCIVRQISSFIPDSKHMTIGNQVISILESYRKKESFPNSLYICKAYKEEKINKFFSWVLFTFIFLTVYEFALWLDGRNFDFLDILFYFLGAIFSSLIITKLIPNIEISQQQVL
ncbi:hypothetical protein [Tenacibaculum jejuense]|uniref:hypothetical protein n=1 Tax=Tenacibaculum jejuense TaxID=584609 RepID=UPI0012FDE6D8|nr:hypothetical protein [Tenacibaculum jejuense]